LLHRALAVWGRTPGSVGDQDVEQLSSQAARDRHRTGGSDHHRQVPLPGLPSCWTYCRYSCLPSKSTVDGHIRTETQPTIHPALRGGICLCNITSLKTLSWVPEEYQTNISGRDRDTRQGQCRDTSVAICYSASPYVPLCWGWIPFGKGNR
jgi:hypothetical protein